MAPALYAAAVRLEQREGSLTSAAWLLLQVLAPALLRGTLSMLLKAMPADFPWMAFKTVRSRLSPYSQCEHKDRKCVCRPEMVSFSLTAKSLRLD